MGPIMMNHRVVLLMMLLTNDDLTGLKPTSILDQ